MSLFLFRSSFSASNLCNNRDGYVRGTIKMRFFTIGMAAAAAYRNLSTKGFSKPSYISSYAEYKNKTTTERKQQRGPRIQWTEEQKSVLSAVKEGNCVFITGSAGTGKTKLLTEVVKLLRKLHTKSKVFVTASTGVSAFALKGQTLHSFAGIHPPFDVPEELVKGILSNKRASRRWKKVKALVIDEIGMVDAGLFDNLEFVARKLRGVSETWGGIQLVVVGDFCQLPPITYRSQAVSYAFEADCWNESFDLQIELTRIFRQSDPRFIELLQRIRMGESDHSDLLFLEKYCSKSEIDPSAVQLFPRKNKVMEVNEKKLKSLQKDIIVYRAVDNGEEPWKSQLKHGIAPDELSICVGARVMLVKNVHTWKGLVNGATGTVVELKVCSDNLLPVVKFDKGKELLIGPQEWHVMDGDVVVACRKQIPLSLAWAMSIHKCQGMTIEKVYIDFKGTFGNGMVYAALSRVRSLEGLHISGFSPSDIQVDFKVSKFYRDSALQRNSKDLDNSCIERNDSSSSITGDSKKASTSETKYSFSLSDFLAKRMKRS